MNIACCIKCKETVRKEEIETLEDLYEGDFEYFHIGCGGRVVTI